MKNLDRKKALKIKKFKKEISDYVEDYLYGEDLDRIERHTILDISERLESEGITLFSFIERNNDSDYWIQAETGFSTKEFGFLGVTFDYDVKIDDEISLDDFMDMVIYYERKANKIIDMYS
jgi:hypothetical protein